jgi:uncharacterized damage-inducible protein DinB
VGEATMEEQVLETWAIPDRINRYLLDAVPAIALGAVSASKGRTVGEQFAHVHNVRSHESHPRGQVALTLNQAGAPLDKKAAFGLWEWGSR